MILLTFYLYLLTIFHTSPAEVACKILQKYNNYSQSANNFYEKILFPANF